MQPTLVVVLALVAAKPTDHLAIAGKAWTEERWRDAANAYQAAYDADKKEPLHIFNAAAATERASDGCVPAARLFERFIKACGGCDERVLAEHRLLQLQTQCPEAAPREHDQAWVPKLHVVEEGWADITRNDIAEARQRARARALKQILERQLPVYVRSTMTDSASSVLEGKHERFSQSVQQSIQTSVEGYVQDARIVEEKQEGSVFKVKVEADIDNAKLRSEIARIGAALALERNPKVMVLVREAYVPCNGKPKETITRSRLQAITEDALRARGLKVVDQATIELRAADERTVMLDEPDKAIEVAMRNQAELLVTADVTVRCLMHNQLGSSEYIGAAEVIMKAIDTSNGVILSSKEGARSPFGTASDGIILDEGTLARRGTEIVSRDAVKGLLDDVTAAWSRTTERVYSIKLWDAPSYESEGRAFIAMLKRLPGVTAVKEGLVVHGSRASRAMISLEVSYSRFFDAGRLRNAVIDASKREAKLRDKLRVEYAQGSRDTSFAVCRAGCTEPARGR